MAYQPAYDGFSRSGSRSRRQSFSHGHGGYPDQTLYPDPSRTAPLYHDNYHSQSGYAPVYAGGELSRYPSRRSHEDTREYGYHDDANYDNYYNYGQGVNYHSTSPNKLSRRHRRHSTYGSRGAIFDGFLHPTVLKFKIKGSYHSGVTLTEAIDNVRLSGDKVYSHRDLRTDSRGNMYMKIMWSGYHPLTYEIPVDGHDGRISLQTLMRRVGRACLHYIQSRAVHLHPDRVMLHSIEEVSSGTWQPVLTIQ